MKIEPQLSVRKSTFMQEYYLHMFVETNRYYIIASSYDTYKTKDDAIFALLKGRVKWRYDPIEKGG